MQSTGAVSNMDPEMAAHRKLMCDKITQIFHQKRASLSAEFLQRLPDIVRRLEHGLYRAAATKDDYLNMDTLEGRLHAVFRSFSSHNQPPRVSSSSSVNTMIPTPGMSHNSGSKSSVTSYLGNATSNSNGSGNITATSAIMGNVMPSANGMTDGAFFILFSYSSLPTGYQQAPVNVSPMFSQTNTMPSIGAPQLSTQLMPTPGLTVRQSFPMNSEYKSGDRISSGESTILTQQQQDQLQHQRQGLHNQNSSMLHGLGSYVGVSSRSGVHQSPHRFSNGAVNSGGVQLIGNSAQVMNGPAVSEGLINATLSQRAVQNHIEPHQQPIISVSSSQKLAGDGYGMNTGGLSGDGIYDQVTAVGSIMSNQSINSMTLQPKSKMYPSLQGHQSNFPLMQELSHAKTNFDSVHSTVDHLKSQQKMQTFRQHQQFQQQPNQAYEQFAQLQQKQSQQNQPLMLKNVSPSHSSRTTSFGGQISSGHGTDDCPEPLLPQPPVQNLSDFHSQFEPNITSESHSEERFKHFSEDPEFKSNFSQGLQQMQQILNLQNQGHESQSELNFLSAVSKPESFLQSQWHTRPLQKSESLNMSSDEQHFHKDFQQRITGQDDAQRPHGSVEGTVTGCADANSGEVGMKLTSGRDRKPRSLLRERQYFNQQRWLLFLRHARRCPAPKGKCPEVNCLTVQQLVAHMGGCKGHQCGYPRCHQSKALVKHYCSCRAGDCPVCVPVRVYISKQRKITAHPSTVADCADPMHASQKTINGPCPDGPIKNKVMQAIETSEDIQSSFKRIKVDYPSSLMIQGESQLISGSQMNPSHSSEDVLGQGHQPAELSLTSKSETVEMKTESSVLSGLDNVQSFTHVNMDDTMDIYSTKPDPRTSLLNEDDTDPKTERMQIDEQTVRDVVKIKHETSAPGDSVAGTKSGKPKIKGVSLTELFTPEQIRDHIVSLRQWVGQSKAKAEKNQAIQRSMSENSCQLCAVEKLTFEPPPIYCSPCGARIKRNAPYYTIGMGDTRHFFCTHCYNETRGDSIEVEGTYHQKTKLEKKKNDEETEEWWVQCDKCEAWQHQICALFNGRRNDGEAEYTCPNCYMQEVERGERAPLPPNAVLGAKDLPRTLLSDHIEQRLFTRLKHERQERARSLGKNVDEVPGAEALVVRVVSSVDKKLEVKQRFLDIFQEENYPTEFPYKSKVVLLFQKIEGVEVCLFGMYVQEFGSECSFPNQRRVYLSYLDSVKYFRPEIKTINGEALRTVVYHEILIGYLEYCKKRGFTSCYIWACPPLKGEDYILYCHPEIQKTPKSDKLREWYLSMLRKAIKENIVVDLTNLYDHFFIQMGECKAKVTAARLPYFDGDYWPGAAEDMINQLQQEEEDRKQQKKGKTKKIITKRSLKAAGQSDLSCYASKDFLLMQKLGETIFPMKEDFIMVHLQHTCTHCCTLMVSGVRWVCSQCKKFQLCDKCHDAELKREDRDRHPSGSREKHLLTRAEINDVPEDTKDKDEILESEFFDTRQAFLSLCQGNHYQYDTLRRAKHSSMMVLYHLHNPTAPAFVTTCNVCHRDIETGQGWRCEVCPDFDVCNNCYQRNGGVDHPHRLTNHPSMADRDAQNKEARQKRVLQLRKMLDLLVHAAQCRSLHCQYPNCRKVKGLFRHGINCRTRASGGCVLCKKMWYLLQLHARACKESNCHVPRCRDLREHLRRLQQQSDSRRRAAVMEMMRQRTAEVAGNA
ncbi:unnamed protein product [Spirodela intermedia]|uniref:histone acetyltransferase n=1 Tax=Spirodela intermedia TaxID=51605 RepID=A0A7I8IZE5_SPIIN|nr:unnamed protein product [Spirodela intermedia]CAA6662393.1 unnamed protein product [Spirodela intermedia]